MNQKISLLDCTLRDGAYIVNADFGESVIKGLIQKLQQARVNIIECGWLKDTAHQQGTTFYHVPSDLEQYIIEKQKNCFYCVMIDWDRYNVENLPDYDGKSVDAVRIVFPHGKCREAVQIGKRIREKGYEVFFQAANTLAYSDADLSELAHEMNEFEPTGISVVDTFGAMYEEDLERILHVLDTSLKEKIQLGFHSHNNQQLSFALVMFFVKYLWNSRRNIFVDASLCGMGRGAGNATTELTVSFLNRKYNTNYNLDAVMDAIDMYMVGIQENNQWGYSTEYFIAGLYCCHVNNIAYLLKNHRTTAKDMRNIIESLSEEERKKYDYDLLERKYIENQNRLVDDEDTIRSLKKKIKNKTILLIAPGKSTVDEEVRIKQFIKKEKPVVIAVNALFPEYQFDYLFLSNKVRYDYAEYAYLEQFKNTQKIVLSNIKTQPEDGEWIVNYNRAIKRGWEHFDNAVICCLRLLDELRVDNIVVAGFDGFKTRYNESYADSNLPTLNGNIDWAQLNDEIKDIYWDFRKSTADLINISFLTESLFIADNDFVYQEV